MTWEGFKIWAKTFGIRHVEQVLSGPERIRIMMKDQDNKKLITAYLHKAKAPTVVKQMDSIRVFANDIEQ